MSMVLKLREKGWIVILRASLQIWPNKCTATLKLPPINIICTPKTKSIKWAKDKYSNLDFKDNKMGGGGELKSRWLPFPWFWTCKSQIFGLILALSDLETQLSNGTYLTNLKRTHLTNSNEMEALGMPKTFCNFLNIGVWADQNPWCFLEENKLELHLNLDCPRSVAVKTR
jgi:hypothetical protein